MLVPQARCHSLLESCVGCGRSVAQEIVLLSGVYAGVI